MSEKISLDSSETAYIYYFGGCDGHIWKIDDVE